MGADRTGGEGTTPATSGAVPRVRVAVALPANSEPPEGALTPGRSAAATGNGAQPTPPASASTAEAAAPTGAPRTAKANTGRANTGEGKAEEGKAEEGNAEEGSTEEGNAEEGNAARTTTGAATTGPATTAAPDPTATAEAPTATDANEAPAGAIAAAAIAAAATAAAGSGPPPAADSVPAHDGRPKKPMLAAAAIVGAVLIGVPFLLVGGEDKKQTTPQELAHEQSDTVLGAAAPSEEPGDYATERPSASASPSPSADPSRTDNKSRVSPKAEAPAKPVAERTRSKPSSAATPKAKPTPKKADKPKPPVWTRTSVTAPSTLSVGETWSTNRIKMIMQEDGNLVIYNEKGKPTWASMTFGQGHTARFQTDGNLVIHNADDRPIWGADVWGHPGAKLILREDGKVVIMDGATVTWSR